MSMKKASSGFRTRWANATTKTHVGIIIRRGSISGTIPMCCLNRTAAEPIVASCQGLPSVKRPIPIPILSQPMWSRGACRTMKSTPCYLCQTFGEEEAQRLFRLYRIGTSSKWGGATIFWQTDRQGQVRTGKIMQYDPATGHRIKEPRAFVSWAHSELKLQDFHLKQCLFGEHLLINSSSPVMLVESEKTAVVMSHFIPDYIWLATGGKNGCFNSEAMQVLKDREVTLIPDLGATEQWKEKSALLSGICKRVVVSNVLECTSDEEQRSQGLDIADFFLYSPSKRQILHQMIQRNPALQLLIDELDLELIE